LKLGVYAMQSIFKTSNGPVIVKGTVHFIQDDAGEEVRQRIVEWMRLN